MKKVVVVTSSPRKNGNSETLARKFAEGAKNAGNAVEFVAVRDVNLLFCIGCMSCQKNLGKCVLKDGMNDLYEKFRTADVLAFATPVYYYSVCGQLKTFLDRLNPLFPLDNKFKDVYLLATAAEDEDYTFDGCVKDIQGWIDCFDGVTLKGVIRGGGVSERGEVDNTDYPEQAYRAGEKV